MQKWLKWRVRVAVDDGRQLVGSLLAFDRYMNLFMKLEANKKKTTADPNKGIYDQMKKQGDIPEGFNVVNSEIYGADGTIKEYLKDPNRTAENKRAIGARIAGAGVAYDNLNKFFANSDNYKELGLETKMLLDGFKTGETTIGTNSNNPEAPWGTIYISHKDWGTMDLVELGKRLGTNERDFKQENYGRVIIDKSARNVTRLLEADNEMHKRNGFVDSNNPVIAKYANNLKIGERWAGYWHNEMPEASKLVMLETDEELKAWGDILKKYPAALQSGKLHEDRIDLSKFGFGMIDFNESPVLKNLRDRAIKTHITSELANMATPKFWTPAGTTETQASIRLANETSIREQVNVLQLNFQNEPPPAGPITGGKAIYQGASGFLNYLKNNKTLPNRGVDFGGFEIQDSVLEGYLTGGEGAEKAKKVIKAKHAKDRFNDEYKNLTKREREIVDPLVETDMGRFKKAAKTNQVFQVNTGNALNYRNFTQNLVNDLFNNNKWRESLIDPSIIAADTGLPVK